MKTIKFSHSYTKMPDRNKVILLEVFKAHYSELSNSFIAYDIEILNSEKHYPIPKTTLLILYLIAGDGRTFTTVRRWTAKKEKEYRSLRGQEFLIEIADTKGGRGYKPMKFYKGRNDQLVTAEQDETLDCNHTVHKGGDFFELYDGEDAVLSVCKACVILDK